MQFLHHVQGLIPVFPFNVGTLRSLAGVTVASSCPTPEVAPAMMPIFFVREALDVLRGGDFDVVLMDCQMPDVDGYEASRVDTLPSAHTFDEAALLERTADPSRDPARLAD